MTRGESNENAFTRVDIQERRLRRSFPSFCSLFSRGFKRGKKEKEKGGERDGERRPGGGGKHGCTPVCVPGVCLLKGINLRICTGCPVKLASLKRYYLARFRDTILIVFCN